MKEKRERRELRRKTGVTLVDEVDSTKNPSDIIGKKYGFEEIFAFEGLRDGRAVVKPDETTSDGRHYPLEVHACDGRLYLVGYMKPDDLRTLTSSTERREVVLWMRRTSAATSLLRVPVSIVDEHKTRGDRSAVGRSKNIFRIVLTVREGAKPE